MPDDVVKPDAVAMPVGVIIDRFGPLPQPIDTTAHEAVLPDVALSGLAGSGKDTAAQALVDTWGYTVGKFAKPLYDAVLKLDPYLNDQGLRLAERVDRFGWEQVKRYNPEARRLLQVFGTEVGRQMFGDDFWVDRARAWRSKVAGPVVWTDCRFPNEVAYVTSQPGLWVHIERPGQDVEGAGHASESSLPDLEGADVILQNDGSLATLHHRIVLAVDRHVR